MFLAKYADRVEQIQLAVAGPLVNALAAQHKVQPFHVALHIPGLCHAHNPRRDPSPDCAFCARRGNCFSDRMADPRQDGDDPHDLVKRFQLPIFELLVDFADELLDAVAAARGVPVEEVRASHVEPLRGYLRAAAAAEDSPASPENDGPAPLEPVLVLMDVTNS